ncbi:MAG: polymer-forming cytoskeletal protein [Aquificaceae bacterium]|nr:polymer-forming cytoskeletal protein [Aquificaceae bacterium]
MFGKRQDDKKAGTNLQMLLGEGSEFEGNLKLKGGIVRVDGSIKGDVTGHAHVIVGRSGLIQGDVKVDHLSVYGLVKGNIQARELELYSGCLVEGDVDVEVIYIEKGAVFRGRCSVKGAGETPMSQSSSVETSPTGSPSS